MGYRHSLQPCRRAIAAVLAVLIGLGPWLTPAYAGLIPLADEPIDIQNKAPPNIVLTVDDSSSMLADWLPEAVAADDYDINPDCRDGVGAMTSVCGSLGSSTDYSSFFGATNKYFSPGYTGQQFGYPYPQYTGNYDPSGPGSGCNIGNPPTCYHGVDPVNLPGGLTQPNGIGNLPVWDPNDPTSPPPGWALAAQPYPYWQLWPAPVHNAALNTLYYNPELTYDPPVDSTGASYAQMDAADTATWTQVPGDPWATSVVYVDLTASVTVGLWCNSDWSLGSQNDPTQCRRNGTAAPAVGTGSATDGQDYTYPWAPPGFTASASTGDTFAANGGNPYLRVPSTALSYAAQKVNLDPTTLTGTSINTTNWAAANEDAKFFYENENVLWCDPTSPSWPQTGSTETQICENFAIQFCGGAVPGTCSGVNAPSCSGSSPGACNGFIPGACNGYIPPGCNGVAGPVCNGAAGPVCNGFVPAACNNVQPPQCNTGAQVCNGTTQSCNTTTQTCTGPLHQMCNLPGTQTCQPPICTPGFSPPGCNLLPPDPENPCVPTTTCAPPVCTPNPGTCSLTGASCTVAGSDLAECPDQPGVCSVDGQSCINAGACALIGHCSNDGLSCSPGNPGSCAVLGGTCSLTGAPCNGTTNLCAPAGHCVTPAATICTGSAQCQTTPGTCNNPAGLSCTTSATCSNVNGTCVNPSGQPCQSAAQCSPTLGTCVTPSGQPCSSAAQCSQTPGTGTCTVGGAACTLNTDCPSQQGTCNNPPNASCDTTTICPNVQGTCNNPPNQSCDLTTLCSSVSGVCVTPAGQMCSSAAACSPTPGSCNNPSGQSCLQNSDCTSVPGACTIQTNLTCTMPGFDPAECPLIVGTCSITGAVCSPFFPPFTTCPNLPGPLTPVAATCSTGGVGGVAAATLRQDAESNGVVCRRNNKAYAGANPIAAGAYNYPSGKYITPITGGTGDDACTVTPHFVSVPRHYWNTSVEWCDTKIASAGDKWLGYGTDVNGTCQAGYDSAHTYPRFYQFGAASFVDNYANAAFQRVDLDITQRATASYTTTWTDASGQLQTITRSFDDEMTNYANWFAYYRTRIQAVKTVTSLVFNQLDDKYNVGFETLSNGSLTDAVPPQSDPATFVDIAPFAAPQKSAWFQQLFAIDIPLRLQTPTLDAMARIGDYYLNGTSSVLPGSTDPITLSCQKNWHMLFTDGFVNQALLPATTVGDQDLTVPNYPDFATNPIPGMVPGSPWPHPYEEDPTNPDANGQADYAMYYWVTNLRTSGPLAIDNVPTSSTDPADWPHLNFAALSLGTQGQLPASNPSLTMNQLAAGTLQWPQPYPTVNHPNNSGVDDLWHAAVNGRGQFVNANSAAQLELGMGQILQNITNQAGSRAAAGFSTNSISASNNSFYRVSFQPGWGGSLAKIPVDPVSGLSGAPIWDAATQLGLQLTIAHPGDTPWFTNRNIFTVNNAHVAVPFLWGNLSPAQQNSLAPGRPATGQKILSFLRGDPTNEGISVGQLRVRATIASGEDFLGDIVNSSPVYVGPPNAPYLDGNDPGYSSFVASQAGRRAMVYVGANDGMAHAFNDTTGNEAWAFVPHDLYVSGATGLGALSYQDGALPPFRHHYYVDSTPRVIDVDFGGENWHSLLVGGLGKGGHSYYALDVTNPASVTDDATAASQYLWTFTDPDMGYSYMQPIVAKTNAFGGAWLVIVAAGYNNPSGVGKIFFIKAADGTLVQTLSTNFGNAANPSGLAQIAGYTTDYHNQLVEQIYGGDLYGNLWRFDVSDPNPANWSGNVVKMASLTDPSGNPQPVTTPPNIEVDAVNGINRWVFVGTGRLLDDTDLTTPSIANQIQTMYAFRDGTGTTPSTITTPLQPRVDLVPIVDQINGLSAEPLHGWYDDLPAGQRIVTPPQAAISLVAYAGTSPQTDPCLTGEPATLYVRNFSFGQSLLDDLGGNPTSGIAEASGAVGMGIFSFPPTTGTSASSGALDIRIGVTAGTTGNVTFFNVNVNFPFLARRMSWRLLSQ